MTTTRPPASAAASGPAPQDVACESLLQLIGALPQARMPLIEEGPELIAAVADVLGSLGRWTLSGALEWLEGHEYCKGRLTWSHYHGWTCTIVAPDLDTLHGGVLKRDVTAFGVSPEEAVGNAILYATREEPPR